MTGPGIFSYSTTPANNINANTGINWDEGMSPAAVNNSARQNMTDIRNQHNDLMWFRYGKGDLDYSPVYVSSTSYKIAGVDVSTKYEVGRRTKVVGAGTGTIYGTIKSVAFSTDTTVTVAWDSGSLSNEALTVYLAQVPVTGKPIPVSALAWNRYTNFGAISAYADSDNSKYVNGGYGSSWVLTPNSTGKVRMRVTGSMTESNAGGTAEIKGPYYGTGTAPVQGAAISGTNMISNSILFTPLVAGAKAPFTVEGEVSGLTIGTAYWFDLGVGAVSIGTATFAPSSVIIEEIAL